MKKASIDIGTNSTRMIIADVGTISYKTLARQSKVTRLGEGINETGHIKLSAMDRTLKIIMIYKGIIDSYGKMPVNVASTSAARSADNISSFKKLVAKQTGLELKVISPEEEAQSAFLGATYALPPDRTYLVLDIGGGSTELMAGQAREMEQSFSKDIGCVRLYERFLSSDPPPDDDLEQLMSHVEEIYSEPIKALERFKPFELVGTAGTITSLGAMAKELKFYDPEQVHHSRLMRKKVEKLLDQLKKMTTEERLHIPTMEKGREDVILSGAAILLKLMQMIGQKSLLVSETDILDGLMLKV